MATISREAIEALAKNRPTTEVAIPGYPERARLRKLSIAEARKLREDAAKDDASEMAAMVAVLQCSWVDEAGAQMFAGSEGLSLLQDLPAEILGGLCLEALKFSRLHEQEDGKEPEKN